MTDLRPPSTVMTLERFGAAHQNRLSFMRVLLRKLAQGGWQTTRPVWKIDETGVGHAVYEVSDGKLTLSLVAFAHDLPDEKRSDRVIAEAWDATFALVNGTVDDDDIKRLAANVPLQEAGRISDRELVLSRANRSTRLWDHVVARLAAGQQPDTERVEEIGYLMRTTAVYGSGKFGAADFATLGGHPLLDGPFRAEMLSVWLIRCFVLDLVEHMARAQGGKTAVVLVPDLRRRFGIGNSTGLGMAPFLVNHPLLLNAWIAARETALARVRAQSTASPQAIAGFCDALQKSMHLVQTWKSTHPVQTAKLTDLRGDLRLLAGHMASSVFEVPYPWNALWNWTEANLSVEGQEMVVSLMLEPHGTLIDDLCEVMTINQYDLCRIDGAQTVGDLRDEISEAYDWALNIDFTPRRARARFWYVSEDKLEPRLGERFDEPGQELEQPLDVARSIAALHTDLVAADAETRVSAFLQSHPQHRHSIRRVTIHRSAPYSEIRDNLIASDMRPIDMLRCKLSFFGATRFDPRSDRWVRITMFQGAPFPGDLSDADDWVLPEKGAMAA